VSLPRPVNYKWQQAVKDPNEVNRQVLGEWQLLQMSSYYLCLLYTRLLICATFCYNSRTWLRKDIIKQTYSKINGPLNQNKNKPSEVSLAEDVNNVNLSRAIFTAIHIQTAPSTQNNVNSKKGMASI